MLIEPSVPAERIAAFSPEREAGQTEMWLVLGVGPRYASS